jgi:hypothetical protein
MSKVVIKTQDGMFVGGGRETELVDRITRAYLYEDGPDVDAELAILNTTYNFRWKKADAEKEYDMWINNQGE